MEKKGKKREKNYSGGSRHLLTWKESEYQVENLCNLSLPKWECDTRFSTSRFCQWATDLKLVFCLNNILRKTF